MATPAAAAAAASAPATLTKVFVGNLSFKTREAELAQAFSGAGKVLNANIITRGPRSLGYGFVEFGNEAEAKKAVELLNKKELDGREINVEVAKPREDGERAEGPKASGAPRRGGAAGGGRGPRNASGAGGAAAGGAAPAGNNNNNGGGRRNNNQNAAGGAPAPAGGAQRSGDYIPRRRPGFRRGGGQNAGAGGAPRQGNAGGQGAGANAGAAASAPRTSSATTLFVANLPFAVDDKNLEDLFKDFAPVSAHVVKKRNGKSKGFGFVELKNSEDQAKALAAMDKKEVQGRELIVKIALTEQMAKEQAAAAAPAPAPAAASPAPAAAKASPATDKKQ